MSELTDAQQRGLEAYQRGAADERKRIAEMLLHYEAKDHDRDCTCEPCRLFADIFWTGFPTEWVEGHNPNPS